MDVDGRIVGYVRGWMDVDGDGWMDGRINGWRDGWTKRWGWGWGWGRQAQTDVILPLALSRELIRAMYNLR